MGQPDSDRLYRDWNPGRPSNASEAGPLPVAPTQIWSSPRVIGRLGSVADPPTVGFCPMTPAAPDSQAGFTVDGPAWPGEEGIRAPSGLELTQPAPPWAVESDGRTCEVRAAMAAVLAGPGGGDSSSFPQPGDGIAGFRLLSEMGRGTFGRVFLAEESLLGNRLVALKITRAEGDEPRILARLQHTHIVPIHSVRDDPRTGLRVMCMPYVGGANLAQVLEAAAASHDARRDQRSLLRALDIVGLPPPSESAMSVGSRRRRAAAPGPSPAPSPEPPAAGSSPKELDLDALPWSRVMPGGSPRGHGPEAGAGQAGAEGHPACRPPRNRMPGWSRSIVRGGSSWTRRESIGPNDRDPVQPARRFLREASYVRSAAWIAARLAEGLEHAHSHGLLHRDLKPSNILIAADGTPMLLDFNLAADTSAEALERNKGRMGGTLPYMAPEHLDAFHPDGSTPAESVDERADIYALGLILFEIIAGHRPFAEPDPGRPPLETIRGMIDERRRGAPAIRDVAPSVPHDLDAVLRKALQPDPDRRHARAGDLAEDLRRFLDDQPLKYTPEPSIRGRVAKWGRRNPRATGASLIGLLGLTLIIGLGVVSWSVGAHLVEASARLRLNAFRDRFPECQFLLNTMGGPTESLGRGISLAEQALAQAGISLTPPDPAGSGGWLDALSPPERAEARRDLAEVILLVARARVYLADRTHSPAEQRRAATEAVAWLDRAEAIDPGPNLTLYDDRAGYLDRIGLAGRAVAERARRDATRPTTGRDYYLLGTALLSRRETDQAEAALIRAATLNPQGFWPWFALGLCHYDQERFAEAAGDFAVCSVVSPRFAWSWANRGLALARAGRLVEARAVYDRAIEADETMVEIWANRGLVALELGDSTAAVADLERATALGLRDENVHAALGEALGRAGRRDEALRLLDELIRRRPGAILPRVARGTVLAEVAPDRAAGDFREALKVAPRHSAALLGLARLHRGDRPRQALQEALQALECDPNRIDAVELAAWLRGRLGEPAVVADVERLAQHPTANRLYNAACSLALYVDQHPDPELTDRAVVYLRRAVQSGIAGDRLRDDPDLASLRGYPPFEELLTRQALALAPAR